MLTIFLLILSNIFMAFAWYGYFNQKDAVLWSLLSFLFKRIPSSKSLHRIRIAGFRSFHDFKKMVKT
jgi:hypothetical protein